MRRVIIVVYGKVQGVFFRWETQKKSRELNLSGWVRNESDGAVKILAEGNEGNLKELIKWCYNGSKGAVVEKVDVEWEDATAEFNKFSIK